MRRAARRPQTVFRYIKKNYPPYLFILPAILGVLILTVYPIVSSLFFSFSDYSVTKPPENFGFQNYVDMFTHPRLSENFFTAYKNTVLFAVIAVPYGMIVSFLLALLLNKKVKGIGFFRVMYYVPVIIPTIVSSLVYLNMTDVKYGMLNRIIHAVGLPGFQFFNSPATAMLTFILLSTFGAGGGMIIWLAALKGVPDSVYEAAEIDGAGSWMRLFKITLPMCSSMIFYNLINGIIHSLQVFSNAFILTSGNPRVGKSLFFYVTNVYNEAFTKYNMGYASALSWVLFLTIALLTLLVFKSSKWVYYGEEN